MLYQGMFREQRIQSFLLFFLFVLITMPELGAQNSVKPVHQAVSNGTSKQPAKDILILHSYHAGYEWDDSIHQGILSIFQNRSEYTVHVEYLDSLRNSDGTYLDAAAQFWREKYADRHLDLIIASDDPALNFLNMHPILFKDIPIVFCGVNNYYPGQFPNLPLLTGVNEEISIRKTLEIASTVRSSAKKLAVVADNGITGKRNLELFRKEIAGFKNSYQVIEAAGMEDGEVIKILSQLTADDIVLYLGYLTTPSGKRFSVSESVSLVSKAGAAPVFGMWDFLIPHGVVGGCVVHGFSQGESASLIALKVLQGIPIRSIPVLMESPNIPIFNDRELERFNMDTSLLSPDSRLTALRSSQLLHLWQLGAGAGDFGYEMFNNHTSIMLLIDPASGIIIDANKTARIYYGFAQLIGMNISDINTLSPQEIEREMASALESKKNYFQFRHRRADGLIRNVRSYSGPVDLNGQKLLFSIIHDVTDQVAAETQQARMRSLLYTVISLALVCALILIIILLNIAKNRRTAINLLRENERRIDQQNTLINTLLAHLPIGVFMVEAPSGKALIANEKAKELLGRGVLPDTTAGNLNEVYEAYKASTGDHYPPAEMPIVRAMYGESVSIDDMIVVQPNGTRRLLEVSGTPVYVRDKSVGMALVSFTDITERKEMENALRDSSLKLKTLFEAMTELVVLHELVFDSTGKPVNYRIIDCNAAFTKIIGIPREDAVGRLASDVYGTSDPPYLEEYAAVAMTGAACHYETYYAPMEKYFSISAVFTGVNRFATISTDISETKRIQAVIDAKNKELEQIVYVASHDLRSPLVNVDGFSRELNFAIEDLSKLLERGTQSGSFEETLKDILQDMEKSISRIRVSTSQMDKLLKGLLNLSRSGRTALKTADIDMNACLQQLASSFSFILEQTNGSLIVESLPPCRGDEQQLTRIFSNLIDNAVKYRHPDRPPVIRISGAVEKNRAVYRVADNGMGIAQNHLEHVFELFHRLHPEQTPGEGIGLTSVRQSLSRMYGEIKAESVLGQGSVFIVCMPPAKEHSKVREDI